MTVLLWSYACFKSQNDDQQWSLLRKQILPQHEPWFTGGIPSVTSDTLIFTISLLEVCISKNYRWVTPSFEKHLYIQGRNVPVMNKSDIWMALLSERWELVHSCEPFLCQDYPPCLHVSLVCLMSRSCWHKVLIVKKYTSVLLRTLHTTKNKSAFWWYGWIIVNTDCREGDSLPMGDPH